jgi:FkbM family methyltransferase
VFVYVQGCPKVHKSAYRHLRDAVRDFLDPKQTYTVVDFGPTRGEMNVSSLFAKDKHKLIGVGLKEGPGVEVVLKTPYEIPLASDSADLVICGQNFENIPYFWTTFLELARIVKVGGSIFLVAPSRGHPHGGPLDAWRFYGDAFKALAAFAQLQLARAQSDLPARANSGRLDYQSITPHRYWGDAIGVFFKTSQYDQSRLDQVRRPLIEWSNSIANVEATLADFGSSEQARRSSHRTITHTGFGIEFPFDPKLIDKKVATKMRSGRYEIREATAIQAYLKGGERVLELGGGLGFISTLVSNLKHPASYTVVEADPRLIPVIHETHRLNGVTGVRVANCVATSDPAALEAGSCMIKLGKTFWGSSIKGVREDSRAIEVKTVPLKKFLDEDQPEVLIADIEGGETELFTGIDMPSVNLAIIELHPAVTGEADIARMEKELARIGLVAEPYDPATRVAIYKRP